MTGGSTSCPRITTSSISPVSSDSVIVSTRISFLVVFTGVLANLGALAIELRIVLFLIDIGLLFPIELGSMAMVLRFLPSLLLTRLRFTVDFADEGIDVTISTGISFSFLLSALSGVRAYMGRSIEGLV